MNPQGKNLDDALAGVAKRYQFVQFPKNILDVDGQKGLPFKAGRFLNSKGTLVLVSVTIYSDGFVAETMSSTDDSTAFLDDLINWLTTEGGLSKPHRVRNGFVSQIDFEMNASLVAINPRLSQFLASFNSIARAADGQVRTFELAAMNFWTEDTGKLGAPSQLRIERKIPSPFSYDHYFSQAPIQTSAHLHLLTEFENLLKA